MGVPIVEGTLKDGGFVDFGHVDEMCPYCMSEVFNIPSSRTSLCPKCGNEIFPCSACYDVGDGMNVDCDYNSETRSCSRFKQTVPEIPCPWEFREV